MNYSKMLNPPQIPMSLPMLIVLPSLRVVNLKGPKDMLLMHLAPPLRLRLLLDSWGIGIVELGAVCSLSFFCSSNSYTAWHICRAVSGQRSIHNLKGMVSWLLAGA